MDVREINFVVNHCGEIFCHPLFYHQVLDLFGITAFATVVKVHNDDELSLVR